LWNSPLQRRHNMLLSILISLSCKVVRSGDSFHKVSIIPKFIVVVVESLGQPQKQIKAEQMSWKSLLELAMNICLQSAVCRCM
jgi:hypothetical protein